MLNTARTHCKHGHELTADTVYVNPKGKRECRLCRRNYQRPRCFETRLTKPVAIRSNYRPPTSDLHWAAGLFEGEGTITMMYPDRKHRPYLTKAVVSVGNTDYQVVKFFHQRWGGWITKRNPKPRHKTAYQWRLDGRQTWVFLTDLLSFFRTDRVKQKAMLLIEAEEFRRRSPLHGEEKHTKHARLIEYLKQFRLLNMRG